MSEGGWSNQRIRRVHGSLRTVVKDALVSGLAVVVPLVVTIAVFLFLFNYIYQYLDALSDLVLGTPAVTVIPGVLDVPTETAIELLTPILAFAIVLVVGLVVNSSRYAERAVDYFDYVVSHIPGVGSVYDSFRRMSDVMLESDAQNFREVKLVEFPHEGAYTLGFVTTETPAVLSTPAGYPNMVTLFLPLAPNPVMGGHLVHLPEDRVIDVDMTVEEGIRAVVTSGVAVADRPGERTGPNLSEAQLRSLSGFGRVDRQVAPDADDADARPRSSDVSRDDRIERYEEDVSPERVDTPQTLERRERGDEPASTAPAEPPEERTRAPAEREPTGTPPEEAAGRPREETEPTETRPEAVSPEEHRDGEGAATAGAAEDESIDEASIEDGSSEDDVIGDGPNVDESTEDDPIEEESVADRKRRGGSDTDPSA